jgi:hypothetical protein
MIEKKLHFIKQILLGTVTEKTHIDNFLNSDIIPDESVLENIIKIPEERIEGKDQPDHAFTTVSYTHLTLPTSP